MATETEAKERWSRPSRVLHWAAAIMVVVMLIAGFVMTGLPADSSSRLTLSQLHTRLGLFLMAVMVARLVVRLRSKPAPLPLPPLHRRGVAIIHGLLYAVVFGLGASAIMTIVRSDWPDYLHGEVATTPTLDHLTSRTMHGALGVVLIALVVLHVGGVIVQQVRSGDALRRMSGFFR